MALVGRPGLVLIPRFGEAEESGWARPGGLVPGMASFLGRVSTKPFPQLLRSSNCSFLEGW